MWRLPERIRLLQRLTEGSGPADLCRRNHVSRCDRCDGSASVLLIHWVHVLLEIERAYYWNIWNRPIREYFCLFHPFLGWSQSRHHLSSYTLQYPKSRYSWCNRCTRGQYWRSFTQERSWQIWKSNKNLRCFVRECSQSRFGVSSDYRGFRREGGMSIRRRGLNP